VCVRHWEGQQAEAVSTPWYVSYSFVFEIVLGS
jgi:hypothetical protein